MLLFPQNNLWFFLHSGPMCHKYLSSFKGVGYTLLLVKVRGKNYCLSQMFHVGTSFYVLMQIRSYFFYGICISLYYSQVCQGPEKISGAFLERLIEAYMVHIPLNQEVPESWSTVSLDLAISQHHIFAVNCRD